MGLFAPSPALQASPQPESDRPITQSMIVSGPGSFQTGRASRDPGSRPPDRLPGPCLARWALSAWPLAFFFSRLRPRKPFLPVDASIFHTSTPGFSDDPAQRPEQLQTRETLSHCAEGQPLVPSCCGLSNVSIHPSTGCRATSRLISLWLRECRPDLLVLWHAIGSSAISSPASECCWQQSALQGTTAVSLPVWTANNKRLRHVHPTAALWHGTCLFSRNPGFVYLSILTGGRPLPCSGRAWCGGTTRTRLGLRLSLQQMRCGAVWLNSAPGWETLGRVCADDLGRG